MTQQNTRLGIALIIAAVATYSVQDAFSRHLAEAYNTLMVVMIRYWFFAAFVILLALRQPGGLRAMATRQPLLHTLRGTLLIAEICVIVTAYTRIGLVETHAVFACCPLIVAALAGPLLGERVTLGRWIAIGVGLAGVLVILQPGSGVFSPWALLPLAAATMYGLYSLLTRKAAGQDSALVSLFWTGIVGTILITPLGLAFWQPVATADWLWLGVYGLIAILGNWLIIRCYEVAEASAVQPFAYLQLVFVAIIGIAVFDEVLRLNVVIGAAIVVMAGVFTILHSRATARPEPADAP
jgi:drug/metabolite transporter (DMT)-like permease